MLRKKLVSTHVVQRVRTGGTGPSMLFLYLHFDSLIPYTHRLNELDFNRYIQLQHSKRAKGREEKGKRKREREEQGGNETFIFL